VKSSGVIEIEGLDVSDSALVQRMIECAQTMMACNLIGVEVCGIEPGESKVLNNRYRGRNKTATVLSFSLPTGNPGGMAGQILLCPKAITIESRRLGVPYRSWLAELTIHGFLHVLGHRHDETRSEDLMFSTQKALLYMAGSR